MNSIEGLGRTTALGRTAAPDEIANAVTFIASPAASYVNGAVLDGRWRRKGASRPAA